MDGVDLTVKRGETVCVVGESGCGKTVTAMTVLKLIPMPPGSIVSGKSCGRAGTSFRWRRRRCTGPRQEIAIVFQEPMTSLNPVYTVGDQIAEVIALHEGWAAKAALERAVEMLRWFSIPDAKRRVNDYPHQFPAACASA